ncbi:hypothetical protein IZY60_04245 [Lutibacter sp. B2]|nr:hypothetical protein [Lutibacter sp. B2]
MEIRDLKRKYELKVDMKNNIVYEVIFGYWTAEDYKRYHRDYVSKISPLLNDKSWVKYCDLRKYKTSMITEDMQKHVQWAGNSGFSKVIIILDEVDVYSSVVKLQIEKSMKGTMMLMEVFTNTDEADEWLKKQKDLVEES